MTYRNADVAVGMQVERRDHNKTEVTFCLILIDLRSLTSISVLLFRAIIGGCETVSGVEVAGTQDANYACFMVDTS